MSNIYHPDETSTQGFEKVTNNIMYVWDGDCPRCLLPFKRKNQPSWEVKVYTNNGLENWCESCVRDGEENGICLRYSKFSKSEKKQIRKHVKQKSR